MHSAADILATYFVTNSLGISPTDLLPADIADWPVYVDYNPPEGKQSIVIYNTTPTSDGRLARTGMPVQHPGIQIAVRHEFDRSSFAKANDLYRALAALKNVSVVVEGTSYQIANAAEIRPPVYVGEEIGKNRVIYTVNAVLTIPSFNEAS